MQKRRALIAAALAATFLAATISSAEARWFHYGHRDYYHGSYRGGPGPVLGLAGAIVVGAATIATAPFAILAGAGRSAPRPPDYYGPPPGYYGPPPDAYRAPPPSYYYGRGQGYYGPPPSYNGY